MRGVENVILIPGLSHISAKFNDSNPKVVQVQCKRFISAALIEPLTSTIPSENKHSRVVRAITYTQGLDIFYLQNVVLAAAVNMTWGEGSLFKRICLQNL